MAAKKTSKKTRARRKEVRAWGGKRKGAGRPVGTGSGIGPNSRKNRIAVMLSDKELKQLERLAKGHPLATTLYDICKSKLNPQKAKG